MQFKTSISWKMKTLFNKLDSIIFSPGKRSSFQSFMMREFKKRLICTSAFKIFEHSCFKGSHSTEVASEHLTQPSRLPIWLFVKQLRPKQITNLFIAGINIWLKQWDPLNPKLWVGVRFQVLSVALKSVTSFTEYRPTTQAEPFLQPCSCRIHLLIVRTGCG